MADAYDAMVSDRAYRLGMHPTKVLKILEEERGSSSLVLSWIPSRRSSWIIPSARSSFFATEMWESLQKRRRKGQVRDSGFFVRRYRVRREERDFSAEEVFVGTRRIADIERAFLRNPNFGRFKGRARRERRSGKLHKRQLES